MSPLRSLARMMCCLLLAPLVLWGSAGQGMAQVWAPAEQVWVQPQVPEELRQQAVLLCQYNQLLVPVASRFPETVNPSLYIREADLASPPPEPSRLSLSKFDGLGLFSEMARFVQCRVTAADVGSDRVLLWVDQHQPQWANLALPQEVFHASTPEARRAALEQWLQRENPRFFTSRHLLRFRRTKQGWRADYQLPELAPFVPVAHATARAPSRPRSPPSPPPLETSREDFREVFDAMLPSILAAGMTRPEKLAGPSIEYSMTAILFSIQGDMNVKCVITLEGRVINCRFKSSLPFMEDAVVLALQQQRYAPVTLEGHPLAADYEFHIHLKSPYGADPRLSQSNTATRDELRDKALLLCRQRMLEAPEVARLAKVMDPARLIRREVLDELQRHPSSAPPAEPGKPVSEGAPHALVPCEVTEVRFGKDVAVVSLRRDAFAWDELPQPVSRSPVPPSPAGAEPPEGGGSLQALRFVNTSGGWLADDPVPERR